MQKIQGIMKLKCDLTAKPKLTKICYTIQIIYTDGNLNMTGIFLVI